MFLFALSALCVAVPMFAVNAAVQSPLIRAESDCAEGMVPLNVSVTNWDLSGLDAVPPRPLVRNVSIFGEFSIQVRFCEPTVHVPSHADTLLVVVHGGTYNTLYWDFAYEPETYSFRRFAGAEGFATFNVAMLGRGESEHPDPTILQIPLQAALMAELVTQARRGALPGLSRRGFRKIVGISHSLSSRVLNEVLVSFPKAVDAAILTGYAHVWSAPLAPFPGFLPARIVVPERFGNLPDKYYTSNNISIRASLYGPPNTYDPAVLQFDEANKDVVSVAEFATVGVASGKALEFRGDVFAVNGSLDGIFCTPPECGNLHDEHQFYPSAQSFESSVIRNAGHDLTLHLNAQMFFETMTKWLGRRGY
ncbi:hypothetical protein EXIGLDRAFT_187844 [Exidia glandulosa HHB12029]|uniref:AB hydrolase-1 domain-containing protein n=1 Tax=Exidia glandulosa HHB12029 TaxID=1314781 RepID=A0A165EYQ7_EXIGL|nr:hypothetical protein EXIGLDRAFT_187844 [Exidia glandulosa HHB12029]